MVKKHLRITSVQHTNKKKDNCKNDFEIFMLDGILNWYNFEEIENNIEHFYMVTLYNLLSIIQYCRQP